MSREALVTCERCSRSSSGAIRKKRLGKFAALPAGAGFKLLSSVDWELGAQLRVSFNAVLRPNCGWSTGWCSAGRWLRGVRRARVLLLLSPFGRRKHSRFYTRLWRSPATLMLYASCIIIAESSEEPQPWILCVEPRRLFQQCCAGVARRREWQIVSHASR